MTPADYNALSPFERAMLEELQKLRRAVEEAVKALEKAVEV